MEVDADLPYFAGLIDGEGSIGVYSGAFTIEVKMTSKALIESLQVKFGGSLLYRKPQKEGWQPQYRWRVTHRLARDAYDKLKPYLRLKGR